MKQIKKIYPSKNYYNSYNSNNGLKGSQTPQNYYNKN